MKLFAFYFFCICQCSSIFSQVFRGSSAAFRSTNRNHIPSAPGSSRQGSPGRAGRLSSKTGLPEDKCGSAISIIDANKDGFLDRREFQQKDAVWSKILRLYDSDTNRRIDLREARQMFVVIAPEICQAQPDRQSSSSRKQNTNGRNTLKKTTNSNRKITPKKKPTQNKQITPNKQTSLNRQTSPNRQTSSNQQTTSSRQTTPRRQTNPNRQTASIRQSSSTRNIKATSSRQINPIRQTTRNRQSISTRQVTPTRQNIVRVSPLVSRFTPTRPAASSTTISCASQIFNGTCYKLCGPSCATRFPNCPGRWSRC